MAALTNMSHSLHGDTSTGHAGRADGLEQQQVELVLVQLCDAGIHGCRCIYHDSGQCCVRLCVGLEEARHEIRAELRRARLGLCGARCRQRLTLARCKEEPINNKSVTCFNFTLSSASLICFQTTRMLTHLAPARSTLP